MTVMGRACLYRFFDADDNLLYIGKTLKLAERIHGHIHERHEKAGRFEQVRYIEVEWHEDEVSLDLAEASAIRHEQPLWNVLNNRPYKRKCRVTRIVEV